MDENNQYSGYTQAEKEAVAQKSQQSGIPTMLASLGLKRIQKPTNVLQNIPNMANIDER